MRTERQAHKDMVEIGRVCGGHGLNGELRIMPLTDFPERFLEMKSLRLFRPGGEEACVLHPTHFRLLEGKGMLLVTTVEITDRTGADLLKGTLVKVKPDERVPLPEGRYWIDDLVGLNVVDQSTRETLGIIEEVLQTGSNDCYMVRANDGKLKALPAIKEVVRKIDLESCLVEVSLIEGLWD